MPTNKHAQVRYKTLDRCLRDFSRYYTIDDLLNEVNKDIYFMYGTNITLRQLRQDIMDMKSSKLFYAPIKLHKIILEGKPIYYYRYEEPNFSIYKTDLNKEELNILQETIELLRYRRGSNDSWLDETLTRLEYRFGILSNNENLISFEQNPLLKGLDYLSIVIDATINHKPINVSYRTHEGYEMDSIIHPYHIKQFNNRWFLFGLCEENGKLVNRALDRIESIKPTDITFKTNDCYDFNHYFDQVVGVSVPYPEEGKQPITIQLKYTPSRLPYVLSKPIHSSQEIIDKINGIISITVIPTKELDQMILSYMPDIEVLAPREYRNKIRQVIEDNLKQYYNI